MGDISVTDSVFIPVFQWDSFFLIINFNVVFCKSLFVFSFPFSFGHCIVCPSMYGFGPPLWYIQTFIVRLLEKPERPERKTFRLFVRQFNADWIDFRI